MIVQIQKDKDAVAAADDDAKDGAAPPPEWAMIELNGELVMPPSPPKADDDNAANNTNNTCRSSKENNDSRHNEAKGANDRVELGALKFTKEGTPIMIVGSHELRGEVVALKEPLCVMKKRKRREETNNATDAAVDYSVVGVVTKKLLFSRYPKSIMR